MSAHDPRLPASQPAPSPSPEADDLDRFVRQYREDDEDEAPTRQAPALEAGVPPAPTPPPSSPAPAPSPTPAAPRTSLDDFLAKAKPFAPASVASKGENIGWIAERAAFGVLRICFHALNDPGGGLSYGAADVHAIDPELSRIYQSANTVGNVLGDKGQRGKDGRIHEPGMNLPCLRNGKGGRQFSPTYEAASQAIAKLRQHYFTDEAIAAELGLDVETLAVRLGGLWHHDRYAAAYPRGRRSVTGR